MKKVYLLFGLLALVFLGGACSSPYMDNNKQEGDDKQPDNSAVVTDNTNEVAIPVKAEVSTPETNEKTTGVSLTGQALGNGEVKLEWKVSDELKQEAEKYGLTWGEEVNPTYPGRYWFWRGKDHMEKVWSGFPTGTAHFRVCVLKNEECMKYSNDVELEVK